MIYAGQWVRHANKTIADGGDFNDPLYLVFAIDEPEESYDSALPTTDPYYAYRTLETDEAYDSTIAKVPGKGYRLMDFQRWKWHIDCRRYSLATGLVGDTETLYSPPDINLSAWYTSTQPYGKRYYPRMRKGIYGLWQPSTNYVWPCRAPEKEDELCVVAKDGDGNSVVVAMITPDVNDYCYVGTTLPSASASTRQLQLGSGVGRPVVTADINTMHAAISPYHAGLGKFSATSFFRIALRQAQTGGTLLPYWFGPTGETYTTKRFASGDELSNEILEDFQTAMSSAEQSTYLYRPNDFPQSWYYDSYRDAQLALFANQTETECGCGVCVLSYEYSPHLNYINKLASPQTAHPSQFYGSYPLVAVKPLAGNMICKFKLGGSLLYYDTSTSPYRYRQTAEYDRMTAMPFVVMALDCEKYAMDGTVESFMASPAFKVGEFTLTDNIDETDNDGWKTITVELPDFCARQHGRWTWLTWFPKAMLDGDVTAWLEPHYKPITVNVFDTRTQSEIEALMLDYVTSITRKTYWDGRQYFETKAEVPVFDLAVSMKATFTNENTS